MKLVGLLNKLSLGRRKLLLPPWLRRPRRSLIASLNLSLSSKCLLLLLLLLVQLRLLRDRIVLVSRRGPVLGRRCVKLGVATTRHHPSERGLNVAGDQLDSNGSQQTTGAVGVQAATGRRRAALGFRRCVLADPDLHFRHCTAIALASADSRLRASNSMAGKDS